MEDRHTLVSGRSANAWAAFDLVAGLAFVILTFGQFLVLGVIPWTKGPMFSTLGSTIYASVWIAAGAAYCVGMVVVAVQNAREGRAGYSTLPGIRRYKPLRGPARDVDIVDSKTGFVLSRAGEPALSTEEFRARRARVRESGMVNSRW